MIEDITESEGRRGREGRGGSTVAHTHYTHTHTHTPTHTHTHTQTHTQSHTHTRIPFHDCKVVEVGGEEMGIECSLNPHNRQYERG